MRVLAIVLLFGISLATSAQSLKIDSLEQLINGETNSKKKVEHLNQLSFYFFDLDVEKAGSSTLLALQVSRQIKDKHGEAWATAYRGVYYLFIGSLNNASEYFTKSLALAHDLQDSNLQVYALNQLGNVYRDKGVFDSARHFYRQAEITLEKNPDPYYQSVVKMSKGRFYLILNIPDSASIELKESLKLRESLNDKSALVDGWILLGNCYRQQYDYKEAERYYKMALHADPNSITIRSHYLINMGEMYFMQGDFPKALEHWKQVLEYQKKLNYRYELAFLLYRIGEGFEEQGYFDLAIEYLSQSIKISEQSSYRYLIGETYYVIAWVFYGTRNLELAAQNIQKSEDAFRQINQELRLAGCLNVKGLIQMKKQNYDSSLRYHQQGLQVRERIGNKIAISSSLYNMGELFTLRKEYKKALVYLWRGLKIDESIKDDYGKSLYYYQLGKTYNLLGDNDSAEYYLNNAILLAVPNSANDVLKNSYDEMANYLLKIGKSKEATTYYKKYIQITDSLYNKQSTQSLAAYQTLYEVDKKEQEIELLNKDNLLVKAQAQKQKVIFYVAIGGLIVLVTIASFYYRFAIRMKQLNFDLSEKSEEIQTQTEELTEANEALSNINQELEQSNNQLKATMDDLQKTQEQLVQSEKMASLGVLSSGVAHELNNPLNFIKGGVNALGDHLKDIGESKLVEIKTYIDIINEGVNRATAILKSLSHFSRQTDQQNESCHIHKILDNCLLMLNNKLKHRIVIEKNYTPGSDVVKGNEGRLHQAFLNILSNAEQAIEGKGIIHIETKVSENVISISITDTGCGIPYENLSRIRDPFFTTKAPGEGTGLGLSITYKIIENHAGKILVTSEQTKGTKFVISLPC